MTKRVHRALLDEILNARGQVGGVPAALCCSTHPLRDSLVVMVTNMVESSKYSTRYSKAKYSFDRDYTVISPYTRGAAVTP